MRYNKRGLSTVVTTLIIILLVLVAIGIIWIVVRNVIETGSGQIDVASKCPLLDLRINKNTTNCEGATACGMEIYRASEGEEVGVFYKIAITNGTLTCIHTEAGDDIEPLETRTTTGTYDDTTCSLTGLTEASITPYMFDAENNPKLCPNSRTFNF